jgi:hypothetical protein
VSITLNLMFPFGLCPCPILMNIILLYQLVFYYSEGFDCWSCRCMELDKSWCHVYQIVYHIFPYVVMFMKTNAISILASLICMQFILFPACFHNSLSISYNLAMPKTWIFVTIWLLVDCLTSYKIRFSYC